MEILFLDIDGVLNCSYCIQKNDDNIGRHHIEHLNKIVNITKAEVVVTSTWRMNYSKDALLEVLKGAGYEWGILDYTPILYNKTRGDEIDEWLDKNPYAGMMCILDDDNDMGAYESRLIQTTFEDGLTRDHANRAIQLLCPKFTGNKKNGKT